MVRDSKKIHTRLKQVFLIFLAVIMASTGVAPHASAFDVPFYGSNKILYFDDSDCLPGASPNSSVANVQAGPATATLQEFIKANVTAAIEVNKKYGTPYEAVLAQGSLESGNGKSSLAAKYNNFFGIKAGSSWTGQTVDLPTKEEVGGSVVSVVAKFRAFDTVQAGWEGYGEFITKNSRYKDALAYPNDPYKYIEEIKKAGYATDSAYVSKVSAIITQIREYVKTNNLGPAASDVAVSVDPSQTLPTGNDSNAVQGVETAIVCCSTSTGSAIVALSGKDNVEKALNFLMKEVGLNIAQASGVVGNLQQESGPDLSPSASNGSHFGIVQWGGGRYTNLKELAKQSGKKWDDFDIQLQFIKVELGLADGPGRSTEKDGLKVKEAGNDPAKAAELWDTYYERSGGSALDKRKANAKALYDKYKDAPALSGSGSSAVDPDNAPEADDPDTTAASPDSTTGDITPALDTANNIVTIAIDPGHNGQKTEAADPVTGIAMVDYPHPPEDANVMNAAKLLKSKLENNKTMKFKVVLLKNSISDNVSYRERITRAEQAGAALAISLHADASANWTAAQAVNTWRYKNKSYNAAGKDSDLSDPNKVVFKNKTVADLSLKYASAIAKSRSTVEKRSSSVVTDMSGSFGRSSGRGDLLAYGNTANIMLMSDKVPWIYTEYANPFNPDKYAEGIAKGIAEAKPEAGLPNGSGGALVPDSCQSIGSDTPPGVPGDASKLLEFVKKYAWPTYRRDTTKMPDYATAIVRAKKDGRYVGADGIDCGGFITTLMVDSGFDPTYNSNGKGGATGAQTTWLEANWQKIGTGKTIKVSDLRAGDVAMKSGHTFVFVGNNDTYKGNMIASASQNTRAPSVGSGAGQVDDPAYTWYRKK